MGIWCVKTHPTPSNDLGGVGGSVSLSLAPQPGASYKAERGGAVFFAPASDLLDSPTATSAPNFSRLAALFGLFYFWQGIGEPTDGLLTQPVRALLIERGESTESISTFVFLLSLPWTIKPLYGLVSDSFPLAGYRRKSYLVLVGLATATAMFGLAAQPSTISNAQLFWWLVPPAVAVAFSDVVIDALMIERSQPAGWTGQMQAVQWTCFYGAGALSGYAGGYLSQHHLLSTGFLIVGCGALASILLALVAGEDRGLATRAARQSMLGNLAQAWRMPVLRATCLFLLLWSFNPFLSTTVLQVHMHRELDFSEQFFGEAMTWNQFAAMAGTAVYGLIRTRVKDVRWLLHGAIVLGVISTIAYWSLESEASARAASVASGFSGAMALLVQLDLAAQVCPLAIAGTVFSLLMALANLSTFSSEWLGGILYDRWQLAWGARAAFNLLIGVGAATTASCWVLVPWLAREIKAHASQA